MCRETINKLLSTWSCCWAAFDGALPSFAVVMVPYRGVTNCCSPLGQEQREKIPAEKGSRRKQSIRGACREPGSESRCEMTKKERGRARKKKRRRQERFSSQWRKRRRKRGREKPRISALNVHAGLRARLARAHAGASARCARAQAWSQISRWEPSEETPR